MTEEEKMSESKTEATHLPKTPAERKKPTSYTHVLCETQGEMDDEMRNRYYGGEHPVHSLFCTTCNAGIRIGEDGEMVWTGSKEKVPEKTGTLPSAV